MTIISIKGSMQLVTPSGPPPIPKNISTLYFGFDTNNAPSTSPSVISLIFTFKSLR